MMERLIDAERDRSVDTEHGETGTVTRVVSPFARLHPELSIWSRSGTVTKEEHKRRQHGLLTETRRITKNTDTKKKKRALGVCPIT